MEFEALASGFGLTEAPCWDGAGGVYFSDVLGGGLRRWSDAGVEEVLPKRRGIGGMCLHRDGGVVVSGRDVIHVRDSEQRTLLGPMEGVTGYNDLGVDGDGRVYVGALRFRPFAGEAPVPGEVWRIGGGVATKALGGIDWPNGIGFAPDGMTIYACDYAQGTVVSDAGRVFARSPAGSVDGLAVDALGGVWVATGEGAALARFAPDGSLERTVDVPASFVSSVCFGGEDLRDLYVTAIGDAGGGLLRGRCDVAGLAVPRATV